MPKKGETVLLPKGSDPDSGSQNVTTRKKSDNLAEMNSPEMKAVTEQLRKINAKLEEVTQSLSFSHERLEELVATMKANEVRMKYLENRNQELTDLKATVVHMQSELNIQSQQRLLNELEIVGIPEASTENLQHTVLVAAQKIGVELDERDIDWVTRVGPRRQPMQASQPDGSASGKMPRPVVIRLLRRQKRDQLLKAAKSRRNINSADLEVPGPPLKVFINERLTKENRILFRDARIRAKKEGYAFCWCHQGSIYIRQREGKAAVLIRVQRDLDRLFVNSKGSNDICGS